MQMPCLFLSLIYILVFHGISGRKNRAELHKSIQTDSWNVLCQSIAKIKPEPDSGSTCQREGGWRKRKSRRHQVEVLPKVHTQRESKTKYVTSQI